MILHQHICSCMSECSHLYVIVVVLVTMLVVFVKKEEEKITRKDAKAPSPLSLLSYLTTHEQCTTLGYGVGECLF